MLVKIVGWCLIVLTALSPPKSNCYPELPSRNISVPGLGVVPLGSDFMINIGNTTAAAVIIETKDDKPAYEELPVAALQNTKTVEWVIAERENASSGVAPSEFELYTWLYNSQNYCAACRPRKNSLEPVEVTLEMDLFSIDDIREKEHTIIITATLNLLWMDEFLRWDKNPRFESLSILVLTPEDVWLPDFAMVTSEDMYSLKLAPGINVNIYNDGMILFSPKCSFRSICQFDLTFFPFDDQMCNVTFEAWTYLPQYQFFVLTNPPINIANFIQNEQWRLTGTSANAYINCPPNATGSNCNSGASFKIYLSRKPTYYVVNIIIPIIVISIAELSTFTLPIEDPMKVHISFTCLLAFSVFQTAINSDMPRTSDHTPLLSIYIVLTMGYISFAILGESFVFFSLSLAKERTPLPEFVKTCFIFIGKLLFIDRDQVDEVADDVMEERTVAGHEDGKGIEMPRSLRAAIAKTAEFKTMEQKYGMDIEIFLEHYGVNPNSIDRNGYDRLVSFGPSSLDLPFIVNPDVHARDWFYVALVSSRLTSVLYVFLICLTPLMMFLATPSTKPPIHPISGNLTVSPWS